MKSNGHAVLRLIALLAIIGKVEGALVWKEKITSSALDKFVAGVGRSTK